MKEALLFVAAIAVVPNAVDAQGAAAAGTPEPPTTEPAAQTGSDDVVSSSEATEDGSGPYSKRVQGLLWAEFIIGTSWFDPDKYGSTSLPGGGQLDAPRMFGPEWGVAIGVALGGFHLGASYRRGKYDGYKLLKLGIDMKGVFRFVPYVHPLIRLNLYYAGITDGTPYPQLANADIDGGGFTLGAGFMVPIIRWISFTTTFDWSVMGLAVRGTEAGGESFRNGVAAQELGVSFAITFHFIGVRGN